MDKIQLRKAMRLRRKELHCADDALNGMSDLLKSAVLYDARSVVAGYWPMHNELDVRPLMKSFEEIGCCVVLPVVEAVESALIFRRWKEGDTLEEGVFGTLHPNEAREKLVPNLLLVPLLAVDQCGVRLGYGGGFYDRTLKELRASQKVTAIGIAYDEQVVERVPSGNFDQKLDWILTPSQTIRCNDEK